MRQLLLFAALLPALSAPLDAAPKPSGAAGRPDVLVILVDQWNPRCLGSAGEKAVPVPHVDRLAAEGISFDNCYTPCPVCMPARCALMSGLWPHNLDLFGNTGDYCLPPELGRMFQDVRSAGYTTAQIGKLHWGSFRLGRFDDAEAYHRALGLDHCEDLPAPASTADGTGPYQDYLREIGKLDAYCRDAADRWELGSYWPRPAVVEPEDHNDSFVATKTIEFLDRLPADKPYCLVVSFPGPHPPLDAAGEYATMVSPESIELPPNVPDATSYEGRDFDRKALKEARANYYGKMALIDWNVGRIVEAIRRRGTWDRTLVVFTADHGEMMGAHGRFSKGRFFEESARVPLLMRWPGQIRPGTRSAALVQLFDVYPTIVEAAGGEVSPGHFAVSLLPVALGRAESVRDAVFSEIANQPHFNYMVRMPRYVWWTHRGEEALYDMQKDPYQLDNLIDSPAHGGVLEEIHRRHLAYFRTTQCDHAWESKAKKFRVQEEGGGKSEGLGDRLYEIYRKKHGLDRAEED